MTDRIVTIKTRTLVSPPDLEESTPMRTPVVLLGSLVLLAFVAGPGRAEQLPPEVRAAVKKGLDYLAKQQKDEGYWSAPGQGHHVAMTGVAGMAMLMEGSTIREGKYRKNIEKAVDWMMKQSQKNGLLMDRSEGATRGYMHGHGYGTLFLACVYGEEEEGERRKKLEDVLVRAVRFSRAAQTDKGGWGYMSALDGQGFDEGSVTVSQVQSLRAARNAGIAVPAEAITDSIKYLKASTNGQGGVIYSLAHGAGGPGRPALTCAAVACGFSAGEYHAPMVKKWFEFIKHNAPVLENSGIGRFGQHDEYTHYYYAQAVYALGDDGYAKLFPSVKESEKITWSKYKKENFPRLVKMQQTDGSWNGAQVGPIFATAVYLTILQLDLAALPIYQR
jgi:hypothetical protein